MGRGHGGQRTSVAGLVARRRPPTAKGFVFLAAEDEAGLNDVFVKPDVYQGYYKLLRNCFLLILEVPIQKRAGIPNVLAKGAVGM